MRTPFTVAVLLSLIALPVFPALVAGPERAVVAPPVIAAAGEQLVQAIASSGSESLVAWTTLSSSGAALSVSRIDATGARIANSQRFLGNGGAGATSVTWTGESYVVLWTNMRNRVTSAALDREGNLVAPPEELFDGAVQSNLVTAGGRSMFLYSSGDHVFAAILDARGKVVARDLTVPSAGLLAATGDGFALFYDAPRVDAAGSSTLNVLRYDTNGVAIDAHAAIVATRNGTFAGNFDVAYAAGQFAIVYTDVALRRLIVDPQTLVVKTLPDVPLDNDDGRVSVIAAGDRFVAFFSTLVDGRISIVRFDANGGDSQPHTVLHRIAPVVRGAWNGQALAFAWSEPGVQGDRDGVAAVIDEASLAATEPSLIALAHAPQEQPRAARNGDEALVVWSERLTEHTIRIMTAHESRAAIDSTPIAVAEAVERGFGADVVSMGGGYALLWLDGDASLAHVMLQRFTHDGAIDGEAIVVAEAIDATLAWNGQHLLVAYSDVDVKAVRFTRDGTRIDAVPNILAAAHAGFELAAASNGTDFLVAWSEGDAYSQWPGANLFDVFAIRVVANGTAVGTPIKVATGTRMQHHPAVASDGRDFVVAYRSADGAPPSLGRVEAKKLLQEGALVPTSAAAGTLLGEQGYADVAPSIAFTRDSYIVAWAASGESETAVLNLTRIDRSTNVLEQRPSIATALHARDFAPFLAGAGGDIALYYSRAVYDATYGGSLQAFRRTVYDAPARRRPSR
ncbi:MAG TPA: hypothetical protein VFN10_00080 [Thermoanaerobaculia bacterium]|nr:hypothetical protein [Thermoanaerobaculia bacterium]